MTGADLPVPGARQAIAVKFWIMSWESHAIVFEPESLRDEIRSEAETMLHRYGRKAEKKERPMEA